jgi:G6PDH family F420-dependent oxidoreductase
MLEEAAELIRKLFGGEYETYRGKHYTVEQAKLYDAPASPAPIVIAAKAPNAAKLAAEKADGTMNTTPDADIVKEYKAAGGTGPIYGKVTGCFAPSDEALEIALKRQPNPAIGGEVSTELALPRDFEAVAELVRPDDLKDLLALGNEPDVWREKIAAFENAGFTHVALHNVAEEQAGFIDFARQLI